MNPKVKYKLIRSVYYIIKQSYDKTYLIDYSKLKDGKFEDIEINYLLDMVNTSTMKLSYEKFIKSIIDKLSTFLNQDTQLLRNLYKYDNKIGFFNNYINILSTNNFSNISYVISIFLYNKHYFKKHNKFLVFFDSNKSILSKSILNINKLKSVIKDIEVSNETYYQYSQFKSILDIKKTIASIPRKHLKILKIKEIYLHGSFSKNIQNEYSDVDLIIVSSLNADYNMIYSLCKLLFERFFGNKLDIIIDQKKEPPTRFLINAYNTAVKLFDENDA